LVKILGDGEISRPVKVTAHAFSGTAREKIESVGGSAEILER
jgi:large subunit ribosomal protein L15